MVPYVVCVAESPRNVVLRTRPEPGSLAEVTPQGVFDVAFLLVSVPRVLPINTDKIRQSLCTLTSSKLVLDLRLSLPVCGLALFCGGSMSCEDHIPWAFSLPYPLLSTCWVHCTVLGSVQ